MRKKTKVSIFLKYTGLLSVIIIIIQGYRDAFTRSPFSRERLRYPQQNNIQSRGALNIITYYVNGAEKNKTEHSTSGEENMEAGSSGTTHIISNKSIIVINAYLRTGSTFTASLFETYPGVFYIFEPLHDIERGFRAAEAAKTDVSLQYVDSSRKVTISKRSSVYLEEVCSWLSCRLQDLSKTSLNERFLSQYNTKMKPFQTCMRTAKISLNGLNYGSAITSCLKKPIQDCQSASFVVLKFIRMRIGELASLLPYFPNMKIVHLIRDPRGMFNSRNHVGLSKVQRNSSDKDAVHGFCRLLEEDLRHSKEISISHPDKIFVLQYEDIAEHPYEWAKRLYKFAGMEYTNSTEDFVRRSTSATKDTGNMQTQRKNSTATSVKWRMQLSAPTAMYIYNTCRKSMDILGYLPLTTNNLRIMSVPSRHRINVTSN
ncbi:carbohydrate sulfotransferase 3-like isoform X1 [Mya arenaria]|nr:carbohydrate sulfotransferase 3-like isoform X1 [Mya arenaria]